MDKREFARIKKELEKLPERIRYIYLLQLQKYIEKYLKDDALLKEINRMMREIEEKFANDTSWKRDVLTTLARISQQEQEERPHIRQPAEIEQIIQQEQPRPQQEERGVKYGGSSAAEEGYMKAGYFSKHERKTEELYNARSASAEGEIAGRTYSLQEQKEQFEAHGYHTHKTLEEGREAHARNKKHSIYERQT